MGEPDGEPEDTELARADREHHFISIKGLSTRSPTVGIYLNILRTFIDLDVTDRDYARSIRRRVELSKRGCQYVLSKISLAEAMKYAHDSYRVESEGGSVEVWQMLVYTLNPCSLFLSAVSVFPSAEPE